jgi:catechol 2,3-dioxygenase-like lactoylglutathione lyase family enzyme
MKIRFARHTTNLQRMLNFYCGLLGLELITRFENHEGYDGIILGDGSNNWEVEFTSSGDAPSHIPGTDDILVFYFDSREKYNSMLEKLKQEGLKQLIPSNPYWEIHGMTIADPDGFRVVISIAQS